MATVTQNTLLRRPDTGEVVVLNAGEDVPEWALPQVGSHLLGDDAGESGDLEVAERPAKGAKLEVWRAYASGLGIETKGLRKDDLIEAVDDLLEAHKDPEDSDGSTEDEDGELEEDSDDGDVDEEDDSEGESD